MRKRELRARLAIQDTIARYTWCGDFGDEAGFVACFSEDAILSVKGGPTYAGHEGLRRLIRGEGTRLDPKRLAEIGPLHHHVSSLRIKLISETSARSWAYFFVLNRQGPDHWGRYADELVRDEEKRWLFHRRRVSVDGAAVGSVPYPDGLPT